jgi:hypothetical protein
MPHDTKGNVKDGDNKPIASYFNKKDDQFEAIEGFEGATYFHQKGSLVIDFFEGTGNNVHNFGEAVRGLYIRNNSENRMTFTINGKTASLEAFEAFSGLFRDSFTSITVTATGKYKGHINE